MTNMLGLLMVGSWKLQRWDNL